MKRFIFLSLLLLPSLSAAYEPRILDKNVRSMGMGGVGVSTYGYSFSPMANPAALGLMADYTVIPIVDFGFSLSAETVSLLQEISEVGNGSKQLTNINFDRYIDRMSLLGFNAPLSLGYMGKGFGIWMNMGTEAQVGAFHDANSPLKGVKIATVFNTVDKVSNIVTSGGGISAGSATDIEKILNEGIITDLRSSGLSDFEIYAQANKLLGQVTGDASGSEFIKADGTIDDALLKTAWDNIQTTGGSLNLPEETLKSLIPKLALRLYSDIAVNIGYGYKIPFRAMDNVSGLSFGATLRFIQRFKSDSLTNVDVTTFNSDQVLSSVWQAFSISSDFGMSLRLQNFVFAFAARDAFSAPFQWRGLLDGRDHSAHSSSFLPSLDIGVSYRFEFKNPWIQELGMYFEAVDMLNTITSPAHKIRMGLELKLFRFLDLRLGMYDVFVTAGLGMGGKWGRVDFAYYRPTFTLYKGLNITGDQFSLNFSLALENTPERKAKALAKKQERERMERERQASEDIQALPALPTETIAE